MLWVGVIGLVALVFGGALLTGAESGCIAAGDCSCEALDGGLVSQGTNTLTSLAFVAAGLAVVAVGPAGRRAPFTATRTGLYGATLLLTGAGSIAFHGTVTEFAGWADLLGASAIPVFAIVHRTSQQDEALVRRYLVSLGVTGLALWLVGTANGRYVLTVLVGSAVVAEIRSIMRRRDQDARYGRRWPAGVALVFGAGLGAWYLGRDSSSLCQPESAWQWHGIWHLAAALALFALFLHWRSEDASTVSSGRA